MNIKQLILLGAVVAFSLNVANAAEAGDGNFIAVIGAGGAVFPDYEGSDDYDGSPLPLLSLGWQSDTVLPKDGTGFQLGLHDIRASFPKGLDIGIAKLYRPEGVYRASVGVSYNGGRDQDDNVALNGLGDIKGHAMAKAGINFEAKDSGWQYGLMLASALSSEDNGYEINGTVGYALELS